MSAETDIRTASSRFYAALSSMAGGDAGPMADAWSASGGATAQHPIGGRDIGSDTVLQSFARVAEISGGGTIAIADQHIDVGADMAVETGVEKGTLTIAGRPVTIDQRVTNVYRLEDGAWRLKHHHTDLSQGLLDVLAELNTSS